VRSSEYWGVAVVDAAVIVAGPDALDQLRSQQTWLGDVDELRGRVKPQENPPEPGSVELTAKRVAGLDADALRQHVDQVATMLNGGNNGPEPLDRCPTSPVRVCVSC
jgi:hypothetical protein